MDGSNIAMRRSLAEVVEEYDAKVASVPDALAAFDQARSAVTAASIVSATFGGGRVGPVAIHPGDMLDSLLKSAWRHVYTGLQIERIASAADKRRFAQMLEKPPAFTILNIREQFGDFIADPRGNILRGLAECFCDLDPAYKSHDKVKIGVKGLPKRVILSNVSGYGSWGRDKITNILNALAAYQGKPLVTYHEISALLADECALLQDAEIADPEASRWEREHGTVTVKAVIGRGVRLRCFANGNGHLFFEPDTLRDINRALAEFYGEVLADAAGEKPTAPRGSTAVSKDLQYYPTPAGIVESIVAGLPVKPGERILEPSCGCGRFLDALRSKGASVLGIEFDRTRAEGCRRNGHDVLTQNFLETVPTGDFDQVVMNPPFYGKHYAKHVRHALRFLKPGGRLTAILPATARYDHALLDDLKPRWNDLAPGAFAESGTNIVTTVLTAFSGARP